MSDESTTQRICLERKNEILRHLAIAKGLIEAASSYPFERDKWQESLGSVIAEVKGSFYGNFQGGLQ